MTRSYLQLKAIVLKKRTFASRDALFTLLTDTEGKMAVYGKNIRTLTGKRIAHMQTGNLISAALSASNDALYLHETALISAFSEIKRSRTLFNTAYVMLYVLDRILPEREADPSVFALTLKFLSVLSSSPDEPNLTLEKYLNKLLKHLGYAKQDETLDDAIRQIESLIHEKIPVDSI